jgi:molybdopterin synthase catalytic subunit
VYLTAEPIDLADFIGNARPSDGAVCAFVGVVRNESDGRETVAIEYEAYGEMAEEWPGARFRIRHRVGRLSIGESSVAIVATAPHRDEAFAACRAAIERIKKSVPIWKREICPDGSSEWVDPTRPDTIARP